MSNTENPGRTFFDDALSIGKWSLAAIAQHLWIRVFIVLAIALVVIGALVPSEMRSALSLQAVDWLGPAVVVGGIVGWFAYKRSIWLWTTAWLVAGSILLRVLLPFIDDSAIQQPSSKSIPTHPNDLHLAFEAVFNGRPTEVDEGQKLLFSPKVLVPLGNNTFALIAEGAAPTEPPEAVACHACSGKLRVTFVKKSGDAFGLLSPMVQADVDGDGWGRAPEWRISQSPNGGMGIAVLTVHTTYADMGSLSCSTDVYRLTSKAIVKIKTGKNRPEGECTDPW